MATTYQDALKKHGSTRKAASALGLALSTYRVRLKKEREELGGTASVEKQPQVSDSESPAQERFNQKTADDGRSVYIVSQSRRIKSFEDAMEYGSIDRDVWQVGDGSEVGSYEVTLNINDVPTTVMMWRVKLKLVRKKPVEIAVERIFANIAASKGIRTPKTPRYTKPRDPHLLELSLYDTHFGKLCWSDEVLDDSYDLKIAKRVYVDAVQDLLAKTAGYAIEKIELPIGHDFFQANSWIAETAKGTPVDHVDDRFSKVFDCGFEAIVDALLLCREVAPTQVVWVPGNHDPETSWYLVRCLEAALHRNKYLTFDRSPLYRKYSSYGVTLIGRTHGNEEKHADLPLIMATEVPELWGVASFRCIRTGHFHKRAEHSFNAGNTYNGVSVCVLPSLSGTDHWHYKKGYVKTVRAAEASLFSKSDGPVGNFYSIVKGAA